MNIQDMIGKAKPYVGGAVVGAIAITIVGFSANWVVTHGTMEEQVQSAKVSVLAEVCEKGAQKHWTSQGQKLAALEGWDNSDREKLAKQFTPKIPNDDAYHGEIIERCDDLLKPA